MLFRISLLLPTIAAFVPSPLTSSRTSSIRVISDPTELVTKEANIKSVKRTKPTLDPFNPEFERIKSVPYNDAFP
jgi:hypothetical protein